ncbi:hypothetical protein C8R43DRAFT_955404 [Mycena crocata]|nr:hypothetical protein C8R43DRAFT_955404 [Mycena crocata]
MPCNPIGRRFLGCVEGYIPEIRSSNQGCKYQVSPISSMDSLHSIALGTSIKLNNLLKSPTLERIFLAFNRDLTKMTRSTWHAISDVVREELKTPQAKPASNQPDLFGPICRLCPPCSLGKKRAPAGVDKHLTGMGPTFGGRIVVDTNVPPISHSDLSLNGWSVCQERLHPAIITCFLGLTGFLSGWTFLLAIYKQKGVNTYARPYRRFSQDLKTQRSHLRWQFFVGRKNPSGLRALH